MLITFVNSPVWPGTRPVDRVYGCTYALYPIPNIFILTYAAVLEKAGFIVRYLDAPNEKIPPQQFSEYIKQDKSSMYGLHTVNLSCDIDIKTHQVIRKYQPNAWIVFTGPAPTDRPEQFLLDERTIVARGEPDFTIRDIAHIIKNEQWDITKKLLGIRGISLLHNGKPFHTMTAGQIEDIDSLPIPARHLVNPRRYHNPKLPKEPMTVAITSRNCAFQCIFCVPNSLGFARELEYKRFKDNNKSLCSGALPSGYGDFSKPPVRKHSAERVVHEFSDIAKRGYRSVSIVDDQFLWEEERTMKICEGIKSFRLTWGCLARADRVTMNVAQAMASSGCRYVDLGVESFNDKTLQYIQKNATADQMRKGIRILQDAGIKVKVNMLIGSNPNETENEIWESIREMISLKPEIIMFSIVSPFPGTKFYEIAKREGYLPKEGYQPTSVQHCAITNFKTLSKNDLERIIRRANIEFFLRPDVIARNMWRFTNPRSAVAAIFAFKEKMIG